MLPHCPLQVYENEYDLVLQPDINTRSHTQWFFFAIMNTRRNTRCAAARLAVHVCAAVQPGRVCTC